MTDIAEHIFISHSTADDPLVAALRAALERRRFTVWADSRNLAVGDRITPEIEEAIAGARAFLVAISPHSLNSGWVYDEVELALAAQAARGEEDYPVIPLLLPGTTPGTLRAFFGKRETPNRNQSSRPARWPSCASSWPTRASSLPRARPCPRPLPRSRGATCSWAA